MVLRMCGGCGEALPKVMSCLPSGLRGNPALLGAALYIGWRCEGLGPRYRGCQHSLQHSNKVYRHTTHTHTCLSILATAQGMPTHQLACVSARWGSEAWVEAYRDNQCAPWCLSCSFMLSLSMCSLGTGVCVRHVCCLIRGKFHVTFRWRSVKGCFGVQSLILNVHAVASDFFLKSRWQGMPFRVLPLHI